MLAAMPRTRQPSPFFIEVHSRLRWLTWATAIPYQQPAAFSGPTRLDAGEKRKIAERYANGETMEQLADEYECGTATIWRALRSPFEVGASGRESSPHGRA
jgi:hypothetical protein